MTGHGQNPLGELPPSLENRAISEVYCAWPYRFPIDSLLRSLKYGKQLLLTRELGRLMSEKIAAEKLVMPDFLAPVPLHAFRLYSRGFNQSLEIAHVIGKHLDLPLLNPAPVRTRNTRPQFSLGARERKSNLEGAFSCLFQLQGETVAIIDDILTTGHTANELAKQLRLAGAGDVRLWACAQARPGSQV